MALMLDDSRDLALRPFESSLFGRTPWRANVINLDRHAALVFENVCDLSVGGQLRHTLLEMVETHNLLPFDLYERL